MKYKINKNKYIFNLQIDCFFIVNYCILEKIYKKCYFRSVFSQKSEI